MANTAVTIDQFTNLLKRVEKLEYEHKEIPITVEKDINELKEGYHKIDKEQATFGEKLESVRIEIKSLRREMDKRLDFQSKLLIVILAAILGMFGTLIIFLFNLTKII